VQALFFQTGLLFILPPCFFLFFSLWTDSSSSTSIFLTNLHTSPAREGQLRRENNGKTEIKQLSEDQKQKGGGHGSALVLAFTSELNPCLNLTQDFNLPWDHIACALVADRLSHAVQE